MANGGRLRNGKMDGTWAVTEQGPGRREPRTFEATFADGEPQSVAPTAPPGGQSAVLQEDSLRPPRPQEPPPPPRPEPTPRPQRPPSAVSGVVRDPRVSGASNVDRLGLRWCSSTVGFQRRVFALQAAGAWCALAEGTSSSPAQIRARHEEINAACDSLDAVGALTPQGAPRCRCPRSYRP